jgi:uncharacterized protein YceH (UPF0502 family)
MHVIRARHSRGCVARPSADSGRAFSYTARGSSHAAGSDRLTIELTQNEARVLASLMEKSVITPDQYPLTLNALMLACNQKSSREPVLSLDQGTVEHTARQLEQRHLVASEENFRGRVVKYKQRFCNTPFAEQQLSDPEFAIITLLLLRGRQTPGELRARSGRLYEFTDNAAVEATLTGLIERETGALVARLPMTPGRRDFEYMHLLSGALESVDATRRNPAQPNARHDHVSNVESRTDRVSDLELRIAALERELTELKRLLSSRDDGETA